MESGTLQFVTEVILQDLVLVDILESLKVLELVVKCLKFVDFIGKGMFFLLNPLTKVDNFLLDHVLSL